MGNAPSLPQITENQISTLIRILRTWNSKPGGNASEFGLDEKKDPAAQDMIEFARGQLGRLEPNWLTSSVDALIKSEVVDELVHAVLKHVKETFHDIEVLDPTFAQDEGQMIPADSLYDALARDAMRYYLVHKLDDRVDRLLRFFFNFVLPRDMSEGLAHFVGHVLCSAARHIAAEEYKRLINVLQVSAQAYRQEVPTATHKKVGLPDDLG